MIIYFISIIISTIMLVQSECIEGRNNCEKCDPFTKLCVKCKKDIYSPDDNGGCEYSKTCNLGRNYCLECLEDGKICKTCDIGYFPDESGGCSYTDNCLVSYRGECIECKDNYVLIGMSGYYESFNAYLKICKPLDSDHLLNCRSISYDRGICLGCEEGYYLTSEKKCTKIKNCAKSSFGVCKRCINGYYFDKKQQNCLPAQSAFINCKISNDGSKCDECNDDYYFDQEGKCVNSNYCSVGRSHQCDKCIDGYYLTTYENVCSTEENCYSGRKDIGVCIECNNNYCIDFQDGK